MDSSFEKLVEKCRESNDPRTIHNASMDHAKVLFKNLLMAASKDKEKIRITTGELKDDFYSDLIPELKDCLDKKIEVEILVLDSKKNLKNNTFANEVKNYKDNGNAKILQATNSFSGVPHFIVIGDKRYRYEQDHDNTTAVASFNNPQVAGVLNSIFDDLKKRLLFKLA